MSNNILSKPCSYAIRAMAHLAEQPPGKFSNSQEICDQENIPRSFLGKVFLPLCRARMLRSLRGAGGGYELAVPPDQIRLLSIVQAIDGAQLNDCILEDHPCGNPRECMLHPMWAAVREQFVDYLNRTTVADLARMRKSMPLPLAHADHAPEVILAPR
ncbi:MAG: Rrf2 family transcriptional regulator [Acidipila sp.]|nr:Rrf2 family transcriptional regulator [Acidipila sp.]